VRFSLAAAIFFPAADDTPKSTKDSRTEMMELMNTIMPYSLAPSALTIKGKLINVSPKVKNLGIVLSPNTLRR
jgi:hypothetical protein